MVKAEEDKDQDQTAIITEEKKEEESAILAPLTLLLIRVLPTITQLTLKVEERRLTIKAREMLKNIKARVKHMRVPTTKEDLLIMIHKNSRPRKKEVFIPRLTQKDIHQAVVPQHSMRIPTMTREERLLENTTVKSIMKRTTITTSKERTIKDRRHHQNSRKNTKRSTTTKNLIRSHQGVSNNTIITRQEALITDTKMDTKIIITRKRKQHTSNSTTLITRLLPVVQAIKINTLKSQKIIRKNLITNLLVQILITNSKRQIKHLRTTMERKMTTINARKEVEEGLLRAPMTIVGRQLKDIPLTALPLQSVVVVILIRSTEIIITTMGMKKK